jgi:DNA methylase
MKAHQRFIREELARIEPACKADISRAVVQEITSSQAKEIVEKNEWLRSMPKVVCHCFGIFFDGICGGAVVYSNEYAENLGVWDKYGYTGKIITLARGCSAHWAHPHSASKLIRTSMKMLPEKYKVVTATVDETAGEIGIIYQACGWDFCGLLSKGGNRASIITPDGKRISSRDAANLYGTRSVNELREIGLDVRSDPRKARYFAFIGSRREQRENRKAIEHLIKPYPKRLPQSTSGIQIHREFRALIGPPTKDERQQLEANLVAEGCRDRLVTWNGILLDGHNRFEICERRGISYKTVQVDLPSAEAAKLWIEENQIGRRNLTTDQRAAIAYRIMQRRVAISKQERARKGGTARSLSLVVAPTTEQSSSPRQRELVASQLGISPNKLRLVSAIAKESPAGIERLVAGTLTIKEAKEEIAERERRRLRKAALKTNPEGSQIHVGDLSLLDRLINNCSVDLFLTDPPYEKESIPLYGKLAELAQRKLKPGGLCAVMIGQLFFDQVFSEITKHLDYYWICGVGGGAGTRSTRIFNRRMLNVLRLVVIFAKRPLKQMARSSLPFMTDLIASEQDKQHHAWGQGLRQFQHLVEHLSKPGQLVVDPFVGGGTVPVACVATGRRYIGTEIDPGVAAAARARVAGSRKFSVYGSLNRGRESWVGSVVHQVF